MKTIIAVSLCAIMSGCDASYQDKTDSFLKPPELSDCKIYRLNNTGGNSITVVRCPYSSTTTAYKSGKITNFVTIL